MGKAIIKTTVDSAIFNLFMVSGIVYAAVHFIRKCW